MTRSDDLVENNDQQISMRSCKYRDVHWNGSCVWLVESDICCSLFPFTEPLAEPLLTLIPLWTDSPCGFGLSFLHSAKAIWRHRYEWGPLGSDQLWRHSDGEESESECPRPHWISGRRTEIACCVRKTSRRKSAAPDGTGPSFASEVNKSEPVDSLAIGWLLWEWSRNLLLGEFGISNWETDCRWILEPSCCPPLMKMLILGLRLWLGLAMLFLPILLWNRGRSDGYMVKCLQDRIHKRCSGEM